MLQCTICGKAAEGKKTLILTPNEMRGLDQGMYAKKLKFRNLLPSLQDTDGWVSKEALRTMNEWVLCPTCAAESEKGVAPLFMGVKKETVPGHWAHPCKKCRHLDWENNAICPNCGYIDWGMQVFSGVAGSVLLIAAVILLQVLPKDAGGFAICPGALGLIFLIMLGTDLNKILKYRTRSTDDFVAQLVDLYDKSPRGEGFVAESPAAKPVIAIGKSLNEIGGKTLMLEFHAQFAKKRPMAARNLEILWDGIGEWQG